MEDRGTQTLNRLIEAIDARDTDAALVVAGKLLRGILDDFSRGLSELRDAPQFGADLLLRCILCKTAEYWSTILELVEQNRAHAAISLLRPICEELVFASFLIHLPRADADEFVRRKGRLELLQNSMAQERFFSTMRDSFSFNDLPSRPHVSRALAEAAAAVDQQKEKDELCALGDRLGWGHRPNPSVKHMAIATGLEPYYDFIYRASSSAVHASVQRLGRMVWRNGETGTFTVTSRTFEQYFRRFCLVWGGWVAAVLLHAIAQRFPEEFPADADGALSIILGFLMKPAVAHEAPKLVTPEELGWSAA
jgi:hypothetical protein